jgi:hypothetical protein
LFPLFATGDVDTGAKFATGVNNTLVPVAKFAADVVDTGVVHLELRIFP